MKENLVTTLDAAAIAAIEGEICKNVVQLYVLGERHYQFARRQNNRAWRQKISRSYYGAYNVSRAIRLLVSGDYSTDAADHKKIEAIPDDFPNRNFYANRLGVLRVDRNTCDYDHTAKQRDLVIGVEDSLTLVRDFLSDARTYLAARGVSI